MSQFFKEMDPSLWPGLLSDENQCLELIASEKWKDGFVCRKCGNTNYCKGRKPFSRRCTRCKQEESATAHTIFHGCRLPLTQAFEMAYMVCFDPDISTYKLSRKFDTRQMTCWKFKKKIMTCIESNGTFSLLDDTSWNKNELHNSPSSANEK
jgi:two-component system, sensor histidine kinase LadS